MSHNMPVHTMSLPIPSMLLGLGGKCLLNWALVFLQRKHICKSFLGVFSVSLSIIDTILTLSITILHTQAGGYVHFLGLTLTMYHVCLLVQILGQIYSALQWPVVVVAGLDHFFTVTRWMQLTTTRSRWTICFVTSLLWYLTALYVFLLSDFIPAMEKVPHNQIHQCWVFSTSQFLQVTMFLLLTLGCAALHAGYSTQLSRNPQITDQIRVHSRRRVVLCTFLNTWSPFLVFLVVLLLLPVGIPAHLALNVAWLCFLNSLLIAVVSCAVCPASQGLAAVPPDSFCEWRFKFSLVAGESMITQSKDEQDSCRSE